MTRPVLLDLFCGAGGAGMGYHRAGFDVIGVDIDDQPDYPFRFVQGDALAVVLELAATVDAVHASPPCQFASPVSRYSARTRTRDLPELVVPTRNVLVGTGLPYVIESVWTTRAGLVHPVMLCGGMFGLDVFRHRGFESNIGLTVPDHPRHTRLATRNGYLPTDDRPVMTITGRNGHHSKAWTRKAASVMGVPWVTTLNGVCEAIPPAYTGYIGRQLLRAVTGTAT